LQDGTSVRSLLGQEASASRPKKVEISVSTLREHQG